MKKILVLFLILSMIVYGCKMSDTGTSTTETLEIQSSSKESTSKNKENETTETLETTKVAKTTEKESETRIDSTSLFIDESTKKEDENSTSKATETSKINKTTEATASTTKETTERKTEKKEESTLQTTKQSTSKEVESTKKKEETTQTTTSIKTTKATEATTTTKVTTTTTAAPTTPQVTTTTAAPTTTKKVEESSRETRKETTTASTTTEHVHTWTYEECLEYPGNHIKRCSGCTYATYELCPYELHADSNGAKSTCPDCGSIWYEYNYAELVQGVFNLVNQERAKEGLSALKWNQDGCSVALKRCEQTKTDFSHDKFYTLTDAECALIRNTIAGENLAYGYDTAAEVMEGWMNSPGHRANILRDNFTSISIAVDINPENELLYWVQVFGDK